MPVFAFSKPVFLKRIGYGILMILLGLTFLVRQAWVASVAEKNALLF